MTRSSVALAIHLARAGKPVHRGTRHPDRERPSVAPVTSPTAPISARPSGTLCDAGAVRRGLGYSLHVTALPQIHQALLATAAALDTDGASPADRKAYRIYADRFNSTAGCVATAQQAE